MKKAVIGQFGGPTSVINSTFISASTSLIDKGAVVYGAVNGIEGILGRRYHIMNGFGKHGLLQIAKKPGSYLLSSKYFVDAERAGTIAAALKNDRVDYLYMIGGNSTAYVAKLISDASKAINYDLVVTHLPKTVDNDILATDHCPGYGSAAKFIWQISTGLDADNRSYGGVNLMIVMGRDAGFLAYSAALARKAFYSGPHLIYAPEREFTLEKLRNDLENTFSETKISRPVDGGEKYYGRAFIVLSEGIWTSVEGKRTTMVDVAIKSNGRRAKEDQNLHATNLTIGSRDLAIYLEQQIEGMFPGVRLRTDIPGYPTRSNPMQSQVDMTEAWHVGFKAVQYSMEMGEGSVVLLRTGGYDTYSAYASYVDLDVVAKGSRPMPDEFINSHGNYPTKQFIEYVRPLVRDIQGYDGKMDSSPYISE